MTDYIEADRGSTLRLSDAMLRVESMIYLGGAIASSPAPPPVLKSFIDNAFNFGIRDIFQDIPEDVAEAIERGFDESGHYIFVEWLEISGKVGFLVEFATPCISWQENSGKYSWGAYNFKWVYGDSIDEAIDKGIVWAGQVREKERAEAL